MSMMKTTAGVSKFSTLTIPNLKFCVNAEHNALMKAIKKVVLEHYEEGHQNRFCQFMHDGFTLKNKDKHQAMGVQFADKDFKHDDVITLAFRKSVTHEADKVAELAEKSRYETFGLEFQEIFSSSVQDLSASYVA